MSNDISSHVTLAEVEARLAAGDTFVLNQVAEWCPDCTERSGAMTASSSRSRLIRKLRD